MPRRRRMMPGGCELPPLRYGGNVFPMKSLVPHSVQLLSLAFAIGLPAAPTIKPLFDKTTKLEADTTVSTGEALITRIGDRVRDRHAREKQFKAYDHFLSFYWEERTLGIEIIDRVARGGKDITVNITALTELDDPNFRCFFRGINTVAEYHHNGIAKPVGDNQYTATIRHNSAEGRALRMGDRMEFELSPFLADPLNGRTAYYGTTFLYVIGTGIVPWHGEGERLESVPLPGSALLGGGTTLPVQYSNEPAHRFKQMAGNISPASAQPFVLGRRLHHTDFGNGKHSEQPNPPYNEQAGKLGPQYVARSCIACHVNNGRALPTEIGSPMHQSVIKLAPKAGLGVALQPQSVKSPPEATASLAGWDMIMGKYADGSPYTLRKPRYAFDGVQPGQFSVRLTPQLVGLGLLEAIPESVILARADVDDDDGDGISGRPQIVSDPETGQPRLGRFGHKAGQAHLRHQIAVALNSDMGVTTAVLPKPDGSAKAQVPELADPDLRVLTRYISTLGVSARRNLEDPEALRGEKLFSLASCDKCHVRRAQTSAFHPLAELRSQAIEPFTDLLLHDLGPGLADTLGEHAASGSEWRTAPLWSIGLTDGVSGGEAYLHDGRARSLAEAILWHGGEAKAARELFRKMPADDRAALIRFLKSL